jgi:ABC-2 type transport system permease protein
MADSLSKLWAIVKREYLERVRSRWFIIATLFGPLLFAALILVPILLTRSDPATTALYNITVIDATTTGLGERVAQLLGGGKYANQFMPTVQVVPSKELTRAESLVTHDVVNRLASGYLVIDSQTVAGKSAYYAGRRSGSETDMLRVTNALREGIIGYRLERHGLSTDQIDSLTIVSPVLRTDRIGDTGRDSVGEAKTVLAIFVAFFLYMSIMLYGQSMLSGVIEEKLTRVAEVVVSSVRPETLLAGKVLGVSAVGLTQQIIWILGSFALILGYNALFGSGAPIGTPSLSAMAMQAVQLVPAVWLLLVVLFFILGFVFFGSLYAAVGATVSSESEARQAAQPVILLLILTVVFIGPVAADPSSRMAQVMSLLPFSAPILMPLRMAVMKVPSAEVVASIVVLILACCSAVWLAARIYRVGLLMYGKRPTLSELVRWIREG